MKSVHSKKDNAAPPEQRHPAIAFNTTLPKGRASGSLHIDDGMVKFYANAPLGTTVPDSDEAHIRIPLLGLRVKLGGASDRLFFFEHPDFPQWSIHTADLSILHNAELNQQPHLAAVIAAMHGKRRRNWMLLVGVALVIVTLPVLLLFNLDLLTLVAARQVPMEWEQKLGQSIFAQYRIEHEQIDNRDIDEPLLRLTTTLTGALDQSPYTFTFHVVRDSDLNAFALPGGTVVINSGLIARADSASELLGVVAHEISHVTARHGMRNIISTAGIALTAQLVIGDASGLVATIAGAAPILLNQRYSRDFEREADTLGIKLLEQARINPHGMESFFKKILAQENKLKAQVENDTAANALGQFSRFLSTHPTTEERLDRLSKLASNKSASYVNLDASFNQLKAAVAASEKTPSTNTDSSEEKSNADDT